MFSIKKLLPILFGLIAIAAVACGGTATPTEEEQPAQEPPASAPVSETLETPAPAAVSEPEASEPADTQQASVAPSTDKPTGGVFRMLF